MGALEWARSRVLVRLGVQLDRRIGPKLLSLSHRFEVEKLGDGRRLLADLTQVRSFLTGYAILAAARCALGTHIHPRHRDDSPAAGPGRPRPAPL
jgi:ABC-type protease/lipase transport system fused ATPase/permease subunit